MSNSDVNHIVDFWDNLELLELSVVSPVIDSLAYQQIRSRKLMLNTETTVIAGASDVDR